MQGVPGLSDFGDVYELGFGLGPDKPPTSAIYSKGIAAKDTLPAQSIGGNKKAKVS